MTQSVRETTECRLNRRGLLVGAIALASAAVSGVASGARAAMASVANAGGERRGQALVAAMQRGGYVLYLRHGITDRAEIDTGILNGDRTLQRNLNEAGRVQSVEIGVAFRALGIPADTVLAGPVFRARETAALAFGVENVRVTDDLTADEYAGVRLPAVIAATRAFLTQPPVSGNTVLVAHGGLLSLATNRSVRYTLPEGGIVVFQPLGAGGYRYVGSIAAEELIALATGG